LRQAERNPFHVGHSELANYTVDISDLYRHELRLWLNF
jgi:hypothetical protein